MAEIIDFPSGEPHHAVARLYGEPLAELPKDLYIPPDALEVFLEAFEGPLDLLLYLIRKANLDVLDIPMAPLTAQYLEYVEAMRSRNLELAAEYLVMAAMLLEIKSRMLLPRPRKPEEAPVEDPRAELVRRLMEYERIKLAAARLDQLPQAARDYDWVAVWIGEKVAPRLPDVSLHDLQAAWLQVMKHARVMAHHKVRREELSVREQMSRILRRLRHGGYVEFQQLFEAPLGVAGLVVSLLAVLELAREKLVEVVQREVFAPIYVRLSEVGAHEPEPA
jgi:segregation and condensation protein A